MFFTVLCVCDGVVVNLTDPITCDGFGLDTPLSGNTVALEQVLSFCLASPRCTELYGQVNGAKLDQFVFLLETTTEFASPLFLETPVMQLVCLPMITLEELNAALWLLRLELDICASGRACFLDKEPLFNEITQKVTCRPCAGCDTQAASDVRILIYIFALILLFGAILYLAMTMWKLSVKERDFQLRRMGFDAHAHVATGS